MNYSELQQKGFEIAKNHEHLPMQDRLNIIANTFGCKTAKVTTSPCFGKYRGCSDISITLDNGASLFVGMRKTPIAKTVAIQNEYINDALAQYHPEIVSELKTMAVDALLEREAADNAVAAEKGLKPYTFLNVELNDGSKEAGRYLGWYYVTLAVDGEIFGHVETGLKYDIARGVLGEQISKQDYFVAGALKDNDVDYVYDNVGHSSFQGLYKVNLSDGARGRAGKTLEQRLQGIVPDEYVKPKPVRGVLPDKPIGAGDQLSLAALSRPSAMGKLEAAKEAVKAAGAEKPAPGKSKAKSQQGEL